MQAAGRVQQNGLLGGRRNRHRGNRQNDRNDTIWRHYLPSRLRALIVIACSFFDYARGPAGRDIGHFRPSLQRDYAGRPAGRSLPGRGPAWIEG
jgi:hypothetical protein